MTFTSSEYFLMRLERNAKEYRDRYVKEIEDLITRRDQNGMWDVVRGDYTRDEYLLALRLLRGGIDLISPTILKVIRKLEEE